MALPEVVTREQWLVARKRLLSLEKQATRDRDAACPGCTAAIDELSDGLLAHLRSRDTAFDLTALGRQEDWEDPSGRAPRLHGADPSFTG